MLLIEKGIIEKGNNVLAHNLIDITAYENAQFPMPFTN